MVCKEVIIALEDANQGDNGKTFDLIMNKNSDKLLCKNLYLSNKSVFFSFIKLLTFLFRVLHETVLIGPL